MSLIVIVVFFLGFFFLFRGRKKTSESVSMKLSPSIVKKWVLGYGIMLVVGTTFYFVNPNTHLKADTPSLSSDATSVGDGMQIVFDALNQGVFDPTKGVVKRGEQTFDFQGKSLSLPKLSESDKGVILVKRTPSSAGKITIKTYMTRMFVGSLDVTNLLNSPICTLNGSNLEVKERSPLNLNFAMMAPDFMLTQFKGMDPLDGNGFSYTSTQAILLVQVPKSVSIKGSYHSVTIK